jgi:hypothetical protein
VRRITIDNNLFDEIDSTRWGGTGRFLQMLHGAPNFVVNHNTILHNSMLVVFTGTPGTGFVWTNNISAQNGGFCGDSWGCGGPAIDHYAPSAVVKGNVIAGGVASNYDAGNYFPSSIHQVGFVDEFASNFRLSSTSPYCRKATDGKDIGVDVSALLTTTQPPPTPNPNPNPNPNPTPTHAVTSLTLFNTDTNQPVPGFNSIPHGSRINRASLGLRNISIRANTSGATGSVAFKVNGTLFRVESIVPYALAGDAAGRLLPWSAGPGSYTIQVTPYTGANATGAAGTSLTVTFTLE